MNSKDWWDLFSATVVVTVYLVALKAIIIGSDFSFVKWLKHGGRYWDWYSTRPEFKS